MYQKKCQYSSIRIITVLYGSIYLLLIENLDGGGKLQQISNLHFKNQKIPTKEVVSELQKHNIHFSNINSQTFIDIMKECQEELQEKELVVCLDQASYHRSSTTSEYFEENNIQTLLLPSKGADFNSIENVWYILKQEVSKQKEKIHYLDDLYNITEQAFYHSQKIKDSIKNVYNSLPKRIATIISKKGDLYKI
ncbi:hypothetical protein ABPG72_018597 [Tetrahymena utriculariae]